MTKQNAAYNIVGNSLGTQGINMSPNNYLGICRTCDLSLITIAQASEQDQDYIVRKHLENLASQQKSDGMIPVLFTNRVIFTNLDHHSRTTAEHVEPRDLVLGAMNPQLLFAVAMIQYGDIDDYLWINYPNALSRALTYVTQYDTDPDTGLVFETERDSLNNDCRKISLGNSVLLAWINRWQSLTNTKVVLDNTIRDFMLVNGYFAEELCTDKPLDLQGVVTAVICDVIPSKYYPQIKKLIDLADGEYGVTVPGLYGNSDDKFIVWPYVTALTTIALASMGYRKDAFRMLDRLIELDGFYEYYLPENGDGYGNPETFLTAASFLEAEFILRSGH